ncbi:Scavenger mRNA decapping enzyme C term binding HIT domain [Trypanosoma vivax]|uniref:HIT domain-containing protein n=1 Tax=Trypanosoma vivax (strain Y486) TaxID=1055687 RepID=G0TT44_TRYVY|nr:hypothetical protein TRVL_02797 [Trypanosoma vivax]KAH8619727.1 Scavenger mRNA decapping enzyme C term binding HIT domain [Trypanosoma vivax]CCC47125.1 conserved hypothetical protein [Trypanosoma vivax Y486]
MRRLSVSLSAGGAAGRRSALKAGSEPRTKLPFLRRIVNEARHLPDTTDTFLPYPPHASGGTKKDTACEVLYKDPQCVVVKDAFPKSLLHCLVIPLDLSLVSLNSLHAGHVKLLEHMMGVAEKYVLFLRTAASGDASLRSFTYMMGFHALPSLPQLHMHLVSRDFDGPCMKTKKHYNTFTTQFFLPAHNVVRDLQDNGRVTLNKDVATLLQLEEGEPCCHWCGAPAGSGGLPQLRAHVRSCSSNRAYRNNC